MNLLKKIIDNETNLFMIPVRLRLKYAFTAEDMNIARNSKYNITRLSAILARCYFQDWNRSHLQISSSPFSLVNLKRSVLKTMRFQNAPILKLFSKVSVFINVFGCFRVDDRRKRMKKFCVFKRKHRSLVGALKKGASAKTVVEFPYSLKKTTVGRLIKVFFFKTHHDCDSHCRKHS